MEPDHLTAALRELERDLAPTGAERQRALRRLRAELAGSDIDGADLLGRSELVRLPLAVEDDDRGPRRWGGRGTWLLAVAAVVVVGFFVTTGVLGNGDNESTEIATAPDVTTLTESMVDTSLAAGWYSTELAGRRIMFELVEQRTLVGRAPDRVLLAGEPQAGDPGPAVVTVAVVADAFGDDEPEAWLEANDVGYFEYGAAVDGQRALDVDMVVESDDCVAFEDCLDIPVGSDHAPLSFVTGPNRLLALDLGSGQSLLVLQTPGGRTSGAAMGDRAGPGMQVYNGLLSSLSTGS